MIAEIIKIIPPKKSREEGVYLTLQMRDLETGKFVQTYPVRGYRNYYRWRRVAREGNIIRIRQPVMVSDNILNADSFVEIASGQLVGAGHKYTLQELNHLGEFKEKTAAEKKEQELKQVSMATS